MCFTASSNLLPSNFPRIIVRRFPWLFYCCMQYLWHVQSRLQLVSKAHNFNAAWRDGDHIHEGLGFLTQHTKLSNMFELAMQAVDPSVTLPYWDYTIESAADQTVFDSVAFTPETFGTLVEPKNHTIGWTFRDDPLLGATIRDGRWVSASNLTQP